MTLLRPWILGAAIGCALAALVPVLVRAQPCGAGVTDEPRVAAVARHLEDAVERGFSGAVLVEVEGSVLLCGGYGWFDPERAHPVTPSTLFSIASITKQLTGPASCSSRKAARSR